MNDKNKRRLKELFWASAAALMVVSCVACDKAQAGSATEVFFDTLGTAAAAAGMPWAAPALHAAGTAVSGLFGTHGATALLGAAVKHHVDFGVTPGRRKKLAQARDAHRAAKKAVT